MIKYVKKEMISSDVVWVTEKKTMWTKGQEYRERIYIYEWTMLVLGIPKEERMIEYIVIMEACFMLFGVY